MIHKWLHEKIAEALPDLPDGKAGTSFNILTPPSPTMGDYATNAALSVANASSGNVHDIAERLARTLEKSGSERIERCQVAGPGFVNIFLKTDWLQQELLEISKQDNWGNNERLLNKRVLVEYTDANPFKQFHIGHLMTNTIGESIARLCEASGAEVTRINYQGDVGVHVACAVWGMRELKDEMPASPSGGPTSGAILSEKSAFLGKAYSLGAVAYRDDPSAKEEIDKINDAIYARRDAEINKLYDQGRQWSLDAFEIIYARLGTKFDKYFFESETGPQGLEVIRAHPDIFTQSQGATIFEGEKYGLHTRVFVNARGLPTYEAKELGLNQMKADEFHPDESIIVTANEVNEYFRVLKKVMELTIPEVGECTRHIGHGMLKLPTGKMSSRTGDVVSAESLFDEIAKQIGDSGIITHETEALTISAIRYSILKQGIGSDIIFDFKESIALTGDSGPSLQYARARLMSIIEKAGLSSVALAKEDDAVQKLADPQERVLMRHLLDFPYAIDRASVEYSPNIVALYLRELAEHANRYYEKTRIVDDEDASRKGARILLISIVARTLAHGLLLLGISSPDRL